MIDLYNSDCLEVMDKLIDEGVKVDYTFTSPPYNRKRNDKYNNFKDINFGYSDLLSDFIDKSLELSEYTFLNIQKNYYNKKDVFDFIGKYSNKIIDIIIWSKSNPMPASGFNITNAYEFIIILSNNHKSLKAKKTYTKNHIHTSVYSENPYKKIHRAVMKPEVVQWFVDRFCKKGDIILDGFMGTGTTGYICKKNSIGFIGIELDKEYFELAKNRIENYRVQESLF